MLRRVMLSFSAIAVIMGAVATPSVSAQQTINFSVGAFVPRGYDGRGFDDVLRQDSSFLLFDIRDLNGATVSGEYLAGLGDFFDAGIGIGYYGRSTPAIDADFTRPNGSEVESTLRLRIVPITATFRYLPLGHHDGLEPYIGAGVGILNWRYTEEGDFVASDNSIISGRFTGSGTNVGPVILGGVRVPVGAARIGGEIRYQGGKGTLPIDQDFAGSTINLGGFNYLFTVGYRF
jgi:hypothetical protein